MVIRKVNEKTAEQISAEIDNAKTGKLKKGKRSRTRDKFFGKDVLPSAGSDPASGLADRAETSTLVFKKMGNAIVTAVGMMDQVNGFRPDLGPPHFLWHRFGNQKTGGSRTGDRHGEILHMTVLIDHNAVDGAPMARFINELIANIEAGSGNDGSA